MLGDATLMLKGLDGPFDFVLVDLWKDLYVPCLKSVLLPIGNGIELSCLWN